jgi:hypothetical protein
LFVPALLSIQNSDKSFTFTGNSFSVQVYWSTFVISLLVTIFNGILTLFKIDRKYFFLNTTLERLRSEGWQYFSLTGRYSGHLVDNTNVTHANQFIYFTHYVEKIKMKQIEEEYYKSEDKSTQSPANINNSQNTAQELYPPSPDQPINTMPETHPIPDTVREVVDSLIKSSKSIVQSKPEENVIVIPENRDYN